MSIPTSIPDTTMAQSHQESIQEPSEGSFTPSSMQVLHRVLKTVLNIDVDEVVSFSKWIDYNIITTSLADVVIFIYLAEPYA